MGQLYPGVSGTSDDLTLAFRELLLTPRCHGSFD